ncbi:MAG: SDR family oxidoreductase [Planctomycetota bacterium]|jgi:short-subunit dehydrogenase
MRNIMVFGATSALAEATARHFARDGSRLFLVARDMEKLEAVADDLRVRGAEKVVACVQDANDTGRHGEVIARCVAALGDLDAVLVAHGVLPDQRTCEESFDATRRSFETNLSSTLSLLTHLANHFEARRGGTIAVLTSGAGDRGRRSNYAYGAAKAAVSTFLQGLRGRLHHSRTRVITLKPGPVATPMTAGMKPGALWSTPERVGRGIHRAMIRGREVAYLPWFWRYVMVVVRLIPESIFKRLRL